MNESKFLTKQQLADGRRPFTFGIAGLPLRFLSGVASGIRMRVHVATTGPEPGNWLIDVDGDTCQVMLGSVPDPDARLYTDSEIGSSILNGDLSIEEALASRLLDYDGDPRELRRFGACFQFGALS